MKHKSTLLAVTLLSVAFMFGCASNNEDDGNSVKFTVISDGSLSGLSDEAKLLETYNNQASFAVALERYPMQVDGVVVDFEVEQVVLVSMGSQSNGGYAIATESAKDLGDYIELSVLLSSPGAGCITTQAFTHPYQLLIIESKKEVRTSERNVTENC